MLKYLGSSTTPQVGLHNVFLPQQQYFSISLLILIIITLFKLNQIIINEKTSIEELKYNYPLYVNYVFPPLLMTLQLIKHYKFVLCIEHSR